ncbi:MAG: polysaccharide deacetylase family protein [Clostridia bacterium]|nr:polysaccharide deacetylase family protein [Clostridia bacterium]
MSGKFFVLDSKKILISILMISVLTILCFIGSSLVNDTIETAMTDRLLPIYSVETSEKKVAITFDCAWGADDIPSIINTLESNDVVATFFTVGTWVDKFPNAVKNLSESGMEIGNHSNSHAHVNKMSYGENLEDMTKCNDKIEKITGKEVKFYRGPYGEYNNTVISVANELNMNVIQWDVDTLDYEGKSVEEMCERIKKKIRNGSIILMHNDTKHTAEGLQQIIDMIQKCRL